MGETAQYTTLKAVIYDYMDEAIQNTSVYRRLWGIACRGLRDLQGDIFPLVKSCRLCVRGNMTAELPTDYITWIKTGVLNPQGEVATLKNNQNLTLQGSTSTNRLSQNTDNYGGGVVGGAFISELYYLNYSDEGDGIFGSNLFGISANEATKIGDFRIDDENGVIILDNNYPADYLILEYVAAPSCEADYKIHIYGSEALIAWLSWKDINQLAASRKVSVYDKTARKREYYHQKDLARAKAKPVRLQDIYNVTQDGIRLVPKG